MWDTACSHLNLAKPIYRPETSQHLMTSDVFMYIYGYLLATVIPLWLALFPRARLLAGHFQQLPAGYKSPTMVGRYYIPTYVRHWHGYTPE